MAETYYIALIHKDNGSDYGATLPDFPGCVGSGPTAEDALANVTEALALHAEGMIADGSPIPDPAERAEVLALPEATDATIAYVPLTTDA